MENINKEELIKSILHTKERIIKSNILLEPKWSQFDETILDVVTDYVIDITLRDLENPTASQSTYNDKDKKAITIFASLTMAAMESDMKNNEDFSNKIYDLYQDGKLDLETEKNNEILKRNIKNSLLAHEQYEKISKLDNPRTEE
jgi:hypothetical protein